MIAQWEQQALAISRKSAEFERLQYRLDRSRDTYQRLLDSIQAIESNQNIEQETVGILASASPASVRPPEVAKKVTQGAFSGLFVGVGIIVGIAFLDVRLRSSGELAKRFDWPLLGIIPEEEHNEDGEVDLLQLKDGRHRFAEACRTLRSSILLHYSEKEAHPPHCILVSSSTPSEGKSTISANLAIALSYINKPVLLIDADMRQGGVHHLFSIQAKEGLSDLLRSEAELGSFVHQTPYANLDLLKNGAGFSNSSELLLSGRMDELLEWAREHYAYIIIDAPPILAVDDTMVLSAKADSMLMVVRANQTSARQVQSSIDRLSSRAAKIIGFAFNCAPLGGVDYYYYYQPYDSYHQQSTEESQPTGEDEPKQPS